MATLATQIIPSSRSCLDSREPSTPDLLEFLASQHVTQRSVCELLARLALDPDHVNAPYEAAAVIDFFTDWLPLHASIEECDLLELIERRQMPGDDIGALMTQWRAGQRESRVLADELMDGLHLIATGRHLKDPAMFRATAIALCSHHRALLQWEDEVLYRFARERLDAEDLDELAMTIASGQNATPSRSWLEGDDVSGEAMP